ncbi:MAG: hypothetical protein ABFC34_17245 [Methanobacterium sp.]
MEELGIIGEARDGYGPDEKFKQDTDASSFRPGKDVPKVKQYGRISRFSPMGGQRSRTQSNVTRTIGDDEGAPRAVKIAKEKSARKMVRKDGKWVKESQEFQLWINSLLDEGYDYYDIILEYLITEGYAETVENAEAIMVSMSEEWVSSIING